VQGGGESLVQLFDRSTSALLKIGLKHKGRPLAHDDIAWKT